LLNALSPDPSDSSSWMDVVRSLTRDTKQAGIAWLQAVVDSSSMLWKNNE